MRCWSRYNLRQKKKELPTRNMLESDHFYHFSIKGGAVPLHTAYFGAANSSRPIFLDDLACTGNEPILLDCFKGRIGEHDCDHSEDAGVRCQGTLSKVFWQRESIYFLVFLMSWGTALATAAITSV